MSQTHKVSFIITLAILFLLPIFFIPGGVLSLGMAKSMLLIFGLVAVLLTFLWETWREGKLNLPWHPVIALLILLPVIYLVSSLLSTPTSLSLFGYGFEVGTFGYMLLGTLFALLFSAIFTDTTRALQALVIFFVSISLVALFVAIKVFFGGDLMIWGNFFGNMGNPIGNWTDLAVSFGLLSAFAALAVGVIPMKPSAKILVYAAFVFGTVLLAIINFSIAFALTLGASILLIVYFVKLEKRFSINSQISPQASGSFFLKPIFLPIVLAVISIVFLINPKVPTTETFLSDYVAKASGVTNIDVRPSLMTTLGISKAVLSQDGYFGSGPNTFERDWLIYKPVDINTTPFWASSFPFGVGFIPTQVISTGTIGTVLWMVFFVLLIVLGIRLLGRIPESMAERFTLISTLLIVLFLWISSFVYTPSATVLMFAFIFSGLFISTCLVSGIIPYRLFSFKESPRIRTASIFVLVILGLGAVSLAWVGFEKTASAYYFKKAVDLSNVEGSSLAEVENELNNALKFAPADAHYIALSRINFVKAQTAANATTGTPEENQVAFEEALKKSIEAAKSAVGINPASYQNWLSLGLIYSSLVPPPLSLAGAYENASFAFAEAKKTNPINPEIPLFMAQLELNKNDRKAAISLVRSSIALKEDYADAYLMLAQLEIQEGNALSAIDSAEKLAQLVPNNPGIYFELGLLKYSSKDYTGAEETFRKALASSPEYANARYYLGLTLARLAKLDEALKEFETLAVTNPDNAILLAIIKDLKAGKRTFFDNLVK